MIITKFDDLLIGRGFWARQFDVSKTNALWLTDLDYKLQRGHSHVSMLRSPLRLKGKDRGAI